jgi:predicted nucleic acid-binding Zn ribbon protein
VPRPGERKRRRSAASAGALVAEVLRGAGVGPAVREHRLVTSWATIVGERVAARAWPDGLHDGVLWVRVANSAWMHELTFLREAIAAKANALVGAPLLVREVRLPIGRRAETSDRDDVVAALARHLRRPPPPRRPPANLCAEELARIDEETGQVADPELRRLVGQLRRRLGL